MKQLTALCVLQASVLLLSGCANVDPKTLTARAACTEAGDEKYVVVRNWGIPFAIKLDARDAGNCKPATEAAQPTPAGTNNRSTS